MCWKSSTYCKDKIVSVNKGALCSLGFCKLNLPSWRFKEAVLLACVTSYCVT